MTERSPHLRTGPSVSTGVRPSSVLTQTTRSGTLEGGRVKDTPVTTPSGNRLWQEDVDPK